MKKTHTVDTASATETLTDMHDRRAPAESRAWASDMLAYRARARCDVRQEARGLRVRRVVVCWEACF